MTHAEKPAGTVKAVRVEKQKEVDRLHERFLKADIAILTEVRGMTVDKVTQLRADLRKGKSELKVVKNTLARRAIAGTRYEGLKDRFKGPVAVALSYGDVVHPAKTLDEFVKNNEKGLRVLGGSLDGKLLSVDEVKELAQLPNLEGSRSRLLGLLMQPAAMLVRVLDQYVKKQGGAPAAGGGPAETAAAEAPPAAT